jgi:NitT/TauT family transport system ATP-binding protein
MAVYRPDLFDRAIRDYPAPMSAPADGVGAFSGPRFDPQTLKDYLDASAIRRR